MQEITTQSHSSLATNAMPGTMPVCQPFAYEGKVRAKQSASFLGIGLSTFWLYVKQGRIIAPMKYGARVSVWDAQYIRSLAENGIPPAGTEAAK